MMIGMRSHSMLVAAVSAVLLATKADVRIEAAEEFPANLIVHDFPRPLAAVQFEDEQGQTRGLADFKGKVIVLNIWATWCVPCRREMPTLDRLEAQLRGSDFQVVPVSIDRGGIDTIRKFCFRCTLTDPVKSCAQQAPSACRPPSSSIVTARRLPE